MRFGIFNDVTYFLRYRNFLQNFSTISKPLRNDVEFKELVWLYKIVKKLLSRENHIFRMLENSQEDLRITRSIPPTCSIFQIVKGGFSGIIWYVEKYTQKIGACGELLCEYVNIRAYFERYHIIKNWRPPRLQAFGSDGRKRNTYEYACLLTRPDCCRNRKKFWMNQFSLQLSG